jgi:hypothetical protein
MRTKIQSRCLLDLRSNLKRALKTSRNLVAVFLLKTNVPPSSCVDSYLSVLRRSAIHLWHALYSIRIKSKKKKKKKRIQEKHIRVLKSVYVLVESSYSKNKRKTTHTFSNVHHCKPNNFAPTCTMFRHELIDLWQ